MAKSEARKLLNFGEDLREALRASSRLADCPRTLAALDALEQAVGEEFDISEPPGKKAKYAVSSRDTGRLQRALRY